MEKVKYSVIIPVYNKQEYLEECISSVLNQNFQFLEVLLLNDGSTDRSLEICRKYMEFDSRVIVVDKPNSGVSNTRNFGIDMAVGEYILFLDADDVLADNFFSTIERFIGTHEMLMYRSCRKRNLLNSVKPVYATILEDKGEILKSVVYNQHTITRCDANFNRVTDYVVSAKLLKENNIRFAPDLKVGEDKLFNFNLFQCATDVSYINQYLYYIRTNAKSVMGSHNPNAFADNKAMYNAFSRAIAEVQDMAIKPYFNNLLVCLSFQVVWNSITSDYCHKKNPLNYHSRKSSYLECKNFLSPNAINHLNDYDKYLFKVFNYPFFLLNVIMRNRVVRGIWFYINKLLRGVSNDS